MSLAPGPMNCMVGKWPLPLLDIPSGMQSLVCTFPQGIVIIFFSADRNIRFQVHLIMSNEGKEHCPVQINGPKHD